MDPQQSRRTGSSTGDGGAGITRNHGQTLHDSSACPIGQMYHVAVDDQVPYWIYSNRQDDGTMRGPSNCARVPVPNVAVVRSDSRGCRRRPGAARGGGGGGGWRRGRRARRRRSTVGGRHWRLRVRLHASRPEQPRHHLGHLLRQQGHALTTHQPGSARSVSPWIHTLDSEPNDAEVPLPLDAAARDRSRSITTPSTTAAR